MPRNRKGFTLAELLVVVAIIASLVATMVVVYNSVIERSCEATDVTNVRAALVEIMNHYVTSQEVLTKKVPVQQRREGWQTDPVPSMKFGGQEPYTFEPKISGEYTVTIDVAPGTEELTPRVS